MWSVMIGVDTIQLYFIQIYSIHDIFSTRNIVIEILENPNNFLFFFTYNDVLKVAYCSREDEQMTWAKKCHASSSSSYSWRIPLIEIPWPSFSSTWWRQRCYHTTWDKKWRYLDKLISDTTTSGESAAEHIEVTWISPIP